MSSSVNTIRALVVDDEKPARELLVQLLAGEADFEIVGECASGREAIAAVNKLHPDIMFLDIRIPEHDGFGVLERLGKAAPTVVFVTAYDEYAVKAFEYHAFDYLLKPFRRERLAQTLSRLRQELQRPPGQRQAPRIRELLQYWDHTSQPAPPTPHNPGFLQRVFVKSARHSISIEVSHIDWIRSVDHFVQIYARGRSYMLYSSIGALEDSLDPSTFLRIHRTTIVNLRSIKEFRLAALGKCYVILKDGSEQAVSRNRRGALRDRLRELVQKTTTTTK